MKNFIKLTTLVCVLVFLLAMSSSAKDIHVPGDFDRIQDALNAALIGDKVIVAPGTYQENVTMKSNVELLGAGADVTTIVGSGGTVVTAENANLLTKIDGFKIDGVGKGPYGIYCYSSSSPTISNVTITNTGGHGIYCYSSSSPTISNVTITNTKDYGIYCYSSSSPTINNTTITNTGGHGIEFLASSSPPTVSNVAITNTGGHGIHCNSSSSPTLNNVTITNTGEDGIRCTVSSSIISNVAITNTGGHGIGCINSSPTINNVTIASAKSAGIYCTESSNPKIRGSFISQNFSNGILIDGSSRSDLGMETEPGGNSIFHNGNYNVRNQNPTEVKAEGNWWGQSPPNPAFFSGKVDYDPWLTEPPPPIVPPPSITSVSPNAGPLAGGTLITITGTHFVTEATVTIGENSATDVKVESKTKITAKTPAGTDGAKDVRITNPDRNFTILPNGFFYAIMPGCELIPDVTTNMLSVSSTVYRETGEVVEDSLSVEVNIITQGLTETDTMGTAGKGQYSVTFVDMQKPVAKAGDEILVTVKDTQGKLVGQSRHTLTAVEVEANITKIDVTPTKAIDVKPVTVSLTLRKGINVISVPVKADKGLRMSDLAEHIGKENLSMIIRYDYTQDKFISYLPTFPKDSPANAVVQPSEGYIVVMKAEKEVEFEEKPSDDETAAPLLMSLALSSNGQSTSIFVVTGNVRREKTGEALNEVAVKIRNLRTGQTVEDVTGTLAGLGSYVATFVASSEEFMTRAGDEIEITAMDKDCRFAVITVTYTLTEHEISDHLFFMPLHLSLPKTFALLPNYPNPFNPETWIPYHLADNSPVTISIYNSKGQLIRTIALGNKPAGVYIAKDKAAYWDGRDNAGETVSSGLYFYTLEAGKFRSTRKMVIVK
ncbi:right-handed parallel beta-helix repeat-containing protein [bacterium]|nr:right-handed parallel beta-helix repeat-containing protein [bacterium]